MVVRSFLVPIVGVMAAVLAWSVGTKYVHQATPLERAVQHARETPMVKAVLADHPDLEASLRSTIETALHQTDPGLSPDISAWTNDIWQRYFVPALVNADDAPLMKLSAGLREFLVYLQSHAPDDCHAFGNLARGESLDRAARASGQRLPAMFAEAYRSGAAHQPVRARPTAGEVGRIVSDARIDLSKLNRFDRLQGPERCSAMVGLLAALEHLPPERGATVMRYLLSASG